jgi:hypothetical protein
LLPLGSKPNSLAQFYDEAVKWRRPTSPVIEEVDGSDGIEVILDNGGLD